VQFIRQVQSGRSPWEVKGNFQRGQKEVFRVGFRCPQSDRAGVTRVGGGPPEFNETVWDSCSALADDLRTFVFDVA
jgi:hypothetical protein